MTGTSGDDQGEFDGSITSSLSHLSSWSLKFALRGGGNGRTRWLTGRAPGINSILNSSQEVFPTEHWSDVKTF